MDSSASAPFSLREALIATSFPVYPATEEVYDAIQKLASLAQAAKRHPQTLFLLVSRSRDICDHINELIQQSDDPECAGELRLATFDRYIALLDKLESVLDECSTIPVASLADIEETTLLSWCETRRVLRGALFTLLSLKLPSDSSLDLPGHVTACQHDDLSWIEGLATHIRLQLGHYELNSSGSEPTRSESTVHIGDLGTALPITCYRKLTELESKLGSQLRGPQDESSELIALIASALYVLLEHDGVQPSDKWVELDQVLDEVIDTGFDTETVVADDESDSIELTDGEITTETAAKMIFELKLEAEEGIVVPQNKIHVGAFGDVFCGKWTPPGGEEQSVVLKYMHRAKLRFQVTLQPTAIRINERLKRELSTWKGLSHPNIAPLLAYRLGEEPLLITPFYENGNIASYLERNPQAPKLKLLIQAAQALVYLHGLSPSVVHGDIKPDNVLIDDAREVALTDLGFARIIPDTQRGFTTSAEGLGGIEYLSPGLLARSQVEKNMQGSDVFAFGGLVLRVLSGLPPFYYCKTDIASMMQQVTNGTIPPKDKYPAIPFKASIWKTMHQCWAPKVEDRPTMEDVRDSLIEEEQYCSSFGRYRSEDAALVPDVL